MSTVTQPPRVVIKALKEWGWEFRNGAGDHVVGTYPRTQQTVSLRTEGEINDHARHLVEQAMGMQWDRILAGARLVTPARARACKILQNQLGEIKDPTGRISSMMADVAKVTPSAMSALLRDMESDGMISRDTKDKRTYRVTLNTDSPIVVRCLVKAERLEEGTKVPEPVVPVIPEPEPEPVAPEPELNPALAFRRMMEAAMGYVAGLEASIAGVEKLENEASELAKRVGSLVEYGQAQRAKARKAQEELDRVRSQLQRNGKR